MLPPSETFCILPWVHLFISVEGMFYPCCRVVDAGLPNVDADGRPHRYAGQESVEAAWNSPYMRDLRAAMLGGERPAPCAGCYAVEDLGTESDRQRLNKNYASYITEAVRHAPEDGHAPLTIRSLDIRLGNLCNLRCRMCSPRASRALLQEFVKVYGIPERGSYVQKVTDSDWFLGEEFLDLIGRFAGDLDEIQFAGGEPLLIETMYAVLRRLIEAGSAGGIRLAYISNLTVLPGALRELWPKFKSVRVAASLDGRGAVNSFIRYPSNWTQLERNLKALDAEAGGLNCHSLKFYTAVQMYNIFSLPALLEYVFDGFTHFEPFPNLILLREPACFSVQTLPPELKTEAAARLRDYVARNGAGWSRRASAGQIAEFLTKLETVIRFMESADGSHQIPEFARRTALHDEYRNQSAAEVIPELAGVLRVAPR